jgi:hypothetical protein
MHEVSDLEIVGSRSSVDTGYTKTHHT